MVNCRESVGLWPKDGYITSEGTYNGALEKLDKEFIILFKVSLG